MNASNVPSENTHPYAIRICILLGNNVELELTGNEALLGFGKTHVLRIVKEPAKPRNQLLNLTPITCHLEAFTSASEAERAGKLFLSSLLWVAASKRVTIGFEKWTGDYPFAVRDRTISAGASCHAEGRVFQKITPEEFASIGGHAFDLKKDLPANVLTSMQFYASARLESTNQGQFIGLMTALEALAEQRELPPEFVALTAKLVETVEASEKMSEAKSAWYRKSFLNRVRQLKKESVRQAILRTVQQHVTEEGILDFVDDAYEIRSKLLHEGRRHTNLSSIINQVEDVLRKIYSSIVGLALDRPV